MLPLFRPRWQDKLKLPMRAASVYENSPVEALEVISHKLHEVGWSVGWVSAVDSEGRTIWIADAISKAPHHLTPFENRLGASL